DRYYRCAGLRRILGGRFLLVQGARRGLFPAGDDLLEGRLQSGLAWGGPHVNRAWIPWRGLVGDAGPQRPAGDRAGRYLLLRGPQGPGPTALAGARGSRSGTDGDLSGAIPSLVPHAEGLDRYRASDHRRGRRVAE